MSLDDVYSPVRALPEKRQKLATIDLGRRRSVGRMSTIFDRATKRRAPRYTVESEPRASYSSCVSRRRRQIVVWRARSQDGPKLVAPVNAAGAWPRSVEQGDNMGHTTIMQPRRAPLRLVCGRRRRVCRRFRATKRECRQCLAPNCLICRS